MREKWIMICYVHIKSRANETSIAKYTFSLWLASKIMICFTVLNMEFLKRTGWKREEKWKGENRVHSNTTKAKCKYLSIPQFPSQVAIFFWVIVHSPLKMHHLITWWDHLITWWGHTCVDVLGGKKTKKKKNKFRKMEKNEKMAWLEDECECTNCGLGTRKKAKRHDMLNEKERRKRRKTRDGSDVVGN